MKSTTWKMLEVIDTPWGADVGPFVKGVNEYVICRPRKSSNVGQGVTTAREQIDLIG